ncbi:MULTISPECIES: hypothetical protein [unclassified Mycobacterium]|uniref:hypothetical protein n=1 Tax=unclassified Mycobacterium TaxID=2642494 RepID=UPI001E3D8706|nr:MULTISPECIES: hypothetical protein [unclassified Mycobacterium]
MATTVFAIGLALVTAPTGHPEPPAPPTDPYPDGDLIVRSYDSLEPDEFFAAGAAPGVWFLTPSGLNCGIWDRGGFGCAGDIPGAPGGARHIGWFNGNIVVRYDPVVPIQWPPGQAQRTLPPRSYVSWNGTMCVTMADSSTYCERGPFRFFITQTHTWLSPPENL